MTRQGPIAIGTPSAVSTGAPSADRARQSLTSVYPSTLSGTSSASASEVSTARTAATIGS